MEDDPFLSAYRTATFFSCTTPPRVFQFSPRFWWHSQEGIAINGRLRRDGRAAEGGGLENRRSASFRRFKSYSLRQIGRGHPPTLGGETPMCGVTPGFLDDKIRSVPGRNVPLGNVPDGPERWPRRLKATAC